MSCSPPPFWGGGAAIKKFYYFMAIKTEIIPYRNTWKETLWGEGISLEVNHWI